MTLKLMGTLISSIYLSITYEEKVENSKKKYEKTNFEKLSKTKLSSCRCTVQLETTDDHNQMKQKKQIQDTTHETKHTKRSNSILRTTQGVKYSTVYLLMANDCILRHWLVKTTLLPNTIPLNRLKLMRMCKCFYLHTHTLGCYVNDFILILRKHT